MGEENQTILEKDPNNPRGCRAPSYIVERMPPGNAMRTATLCIEEVVKIMRDGIAPSYVGDLRKRRALSHVVEGIKTTCGCSVFC